MLPKPARVFQKDALNVLSLKRLKTRSTTLFSSMQRKEQKQRCEVFRGEREIENVRHRGMSTM